MIHFLKLITAIIFITLQLSPVIAAVKLPNFNYSKNTLALIKGKIHTDNIDKKHAYITTGVFFKQGDVLDAGQLIAKNAQSQELMLQVKPHNFYDDGSLRFAIVTIYLEKPVAETDIHLVIGKTNFKHKPAIQLDKLPNIQVVITTSNGQTKKFKLLTAKPEKTPWDSGSLLIEKRYITDLFNGINLDFDITKFHNGHYKTDIVFHYDRILKTPMRNVTYNAEIFVNGQSFKKLNNITHNHHTKWRYPIRFGFNYDNHSLLDIDRIMALGALPRLDLSMGTDLGAIKDDYNKMQERNNFIYATGLLEPAMPTTGTRDDIAINPQWASRYLVSGNDIARQVVLTHGDIAAYVPWHYYDSQTNLPANITDHPKVWIDHRATIKNNTIAPYKKTSKWVPDTAHQPSLTYIPFIITGDRYYYDSLKSTYMHNRFWDNPTWPYVKSKYRELSYEQIRAYGWRMRTTGEMQSILDTKNDKDALDIKNANIADMHSLYKRLYLYGIYGAKPNQTYIQGQNKDMMAELTGVLEGPGNTYLGNNSNFMQDLAALGIGFHAGLGINPWLKQFSTWQSQYIAGRFLNKNKGFPPGMGSAYNLIQFTPNKNGYSMGGNRAIPENTWRGLYNRTRTFNNGDFFKNMNNEYQRYGIVGYPETATIFTAYSRASNALLFNVTGNPDSLESFGFMAQFIDLALDSYYKNPSYRIPPLFDDGTPLSYENIIIGSSGDNNLDDTPRYSLVHGKSGDDVIKFSQDASKGFLFGGDGDDYIDASGGNHTATNISSYGSYLFGGDGNDTFISSVGNDMYKGDDNNGKGQDKFFFRLGHIGQDIIQDFNPKEDIIYICADSSNQSNINLKDFIKQEQDYLMINLSSFSKNNKVNEITLYGTNLQHFSSDNIVIKTQCEL